MPIQISTYASSYQSPRYLFALHRCVRRGPQERAVTQHLSLSYRMVTHIKVLMKAQRHFCNLTSDSDAERAWHRRGDELHLKKARPGLALLVLGLELDILELLSPMWSYTDGVIPHKVPQGCKEHFWKHFETQSRVLWKCKLSYQKTFSITNGYIGLFFFCFSIISIHTTLHFVFCLSMILHNEWKNIKINLISLFPYTL